MPITLLLYEYGFVYFAVLISANAKSLNAINKEVITQSNIFDPNKENSDSTYISFCLA